MASYHLSKREDPRYQSPAKIFARLKWEIQKEAEDISEQQRHGADRRCSLKTDGVCRATRPRYKPYPSEFCRSEELWENNRLACYEAEAQPLVLSPTSSPDQSLEPCSSASLRLPLQQEVPLNYPVPGSTRRTGSIESTTFSRPASGVCRDQITAGLSRTQPKENWRVFNNEAVPLNPRSPDSMYSPMRKRLRKRRLEPLDSQNARGTSKELSEDLGPPETRRKPVIWDSAQTITCQQDLDPLFMANMVSMMSPAKQFAMMKKSESKKNQQQIQSSSRRELFGRNERGLKEFRPTEVSTNPYMDRLKAIPPMNTIEQVAPVKQNRVESPESRSEISEDSLTPAPPSPRVILEDPLILDSPQISIPKKDKDVFRRNVLASQKQFPSESVIRLKKWFLRRNGRGLFVDGIHVEENIPWNSNIITERVGKSVLKTVTGRVYILVGQMNTTPTSDFPSWFLKKFVNGFPSNWKELFQKFLLESKDRHAERKNEDTVFSAKGLELPSREQSVRRHTQRNVNRSQPCPSSGSSTCVTRSGRVVKPPLEFWRGGRVFLDPQMNVTVYRDYYSSSSPDVPATACSRRSKKPGPVFSPSSDDTNQQESDKGEEFSAPVRKVKTDRRLDRAAAKQDQHPTDSSNRVIDCQREVPGRRMSTRQPLDAKRGLCEGSKRQTRNASRPPTRRRRESARHTRPAAGVGVPESDHSVSPKRSPEPQRERRKEQKNKTRAAAKSKKVQEKKKEAKRTTSSSLQELSSQATWQRQLRNKSSAIVPHDRDVDEWTEDEILKLEEAVRSYPKHVAGYWGKVAKMVGTRTAEECNKWCASQGGTQSPAKRTKKGKGKEKAAKPAGNSGSGSVPLITARAGTLKRKQQVRQFLETVPKEDVNDAFSSTHMQKKIIEIPSFCSSEDHDISVSDLEPQTPMSSCFPNVKTPRCLAITPTMVDSSNGNDDRYVYQLQKRMRKNRFDLCKASSSPRKYAATPQVKRPIRKCGNTENFIVWETLPGDKGETSESDEEEEDFYFSDN
ncbi:PREDICTED: mis18-binding protein 1 isoform X1 [Cyprinodon variegatus]|uniref:MIS18 binding protein 1 n=1 Tax=Cyprinodon variegatus TaxID=28743 RepID=A0A3Q2CST2_CYPVA|nr:PREDICTED: mis18-binding protein 1 isoform X1 [Cyprinodon variegatus]